METTTRTIDRKLGQELDQLYALLEPLLAGRHEALATEIKLGLTRIQALFRQQDLMQQRTFADLPVP